MEVLVFDWWWTNHQFSTHKELTYFSDTVICLWKMNENPQSNCAWEDRLMCFSKFIRIQSFGHNWWCAIGIRVETLPRIQYVAAQSRSSRVTIEIEWNTKDFELNDHLHVDVQRHLMGIRSQQERMRFKCSIRFSICKKIRSRTVVTSREVSPRAKGGGKLSFHYCADQDMITTVFLHNYFCRSAQFLPEMCEEYESFHNRTAKPIVGGFLSSFFIRAKRDQGKRAFEKWWSCSQKTLIAKIRRTNWTVITTGQIEQILYGCRIPECCWNRTVFLDESHDERYCRILTDYGCSGFSWVHSAKRLINIWTERLDLR